MIRGGDTREWTGSACAAAMVRQLRRIKIGWAVAQLILTCAPCSCYYTALPTFTTIVTVNPANVTHSIAEETNGCHFSPLDHQLFYVYSQMVYDESFEQSLADKPLDKFGALNNVSLGWMNLSSDDASGVVGSSVQWVDNPKMAFNGNVSLNLTLDLTAGAIQRRVGVAARGLYHQGFRLYKDRLYSGYVAVKAPKASTVHIRLEDWGKDPLGRNLNSTTSSLAHAVLHYPGTGDEWVVLNFTLTPSASTSCTPFPFGQEPLGCSIPNSQDRMPPSATATCVVCGGTLTVAIEDPGTTVSIDQVFLEPGEWGRYKGLHMHKTAADWLLAMGTRMVRYGGTFTQTTQGHWKAERGPSYMRPPCTAGRNSASTHRHAFTDHTHRCNVATVTVVLTEWCTA